MITLYRIIIILATLFIFGCNPETDLDGNVETRLKYVYGSYKTEFNGRVIDLILGPDNDKIRGQLIIKDSIVELNGIFDTIKGVVDLYESIPKDISYRYSLLLQDNGNKLKGKRVNVIQNDSKNIQFQKVSLDIEFYEVSRNYSQREDEEIIPDRVGGKENIQQASPSTTISKDTASKNRGLNKSKLYGNWSSDFNTGRKYSFYDNNMGQYKFTYSGGAGTCTTSFSYTLSSNSVLTINFDHQNLKCTTRDAWGEIEVDRDESSQIRMNYTSLQFRISINGNQRLVFSKISGTDSESYSKQTGGLSDDGKLIINK